MESLCPAVAAMATPGDSLAAPSNKALCSMPKPQARSHFFSGSPLQMQSSRCLQSATLRCVKSIDVVATTASEIVETEAEPSLKENSNLLAPSSFEVQSLLMEVCDETSIAELELKVGAFKLHMKRDVSKLKGSAPIVPVAPPIPSMPMVESGVPVASSPPVASPTPKSPLVSAAALLANPASKPGSRFGLLEAAADEGLLFVTSPKVGLFRRSRVVKGKSGRPLCEEGQIVKEGQVVCYVEQLGTQQPVEAENSGEVMKILCKDGEPVGYGDPLIAIRPSFPGIN